MPIAAAAAKTLKRSLKKRGRPRIGDRRLHVMVPELVYQRLVERARARGLEPARLATELLIAASVGGSSTAW